MRSVASTWVGNDLVALWSTWIDPPTSRPPAARSEMQWDFDYPVHAQWLSSNGTPLFPEPILVTQSSRPTACGVSYGNGRFHAVIQDAETNFYFHLQDLDTEGHPVGESRRMSTQVRDLYCSWDWCEREWIGGMGLRSLGSSGLMFYGFFNTYSGSGPGEWAEATSVTLDLLDASGDLARRVGARVDWTDGRKARPPITADAARGTDTYMIVYSAPRTTEENAPLEVHASLLNAEGAGLRSWTVVSDSTCTLPSVAAIGNQYLVVWLEGKLPRLHRAIIGRETPADSITGESLAPDFIARDCAYLIPGGNQVLCAFPGRPAGGLDSDVYTVRFNRNLQLVDEQPIPLCPGPGEQSLVRGIWDRRQYVVTWSNTDAGSEAILGARVAAAGALRDTIPFEIERGVKGRTSLATNWRGTIMVGFLGNRVRPIHDPTGDRSAMSRVTLLR